MTMFNRFNKVTAAVLCAGVIGGTAGTLAPAAEAHQHHPWRHEMRQLRREIRHDIRRDLRAQRRYERDFNRYPDVMPVYGRGMDIHERCFMEHEGMPSRAC